jgi:hypothetical protein
MHFQFIMANDRRAPYDYFMFVCGPRRFQKWLEERHGAPSSFGADASFLDVQLKAVETPQFT